MLKVTIYQEQAEKLQALYGDPRGAFDSLESRKKYRKDGFDKNGNMKMDAYKVVFDMNIDGYVFFYDVRKALTTHATLEALFAMFNDPREREGLVNHFDFTGRSMSVGDVVKLESKGKALYYFCDIVGFQQIDPANVPLGFEVGGGATVCVGTDRYPAHINRISLSGKTVWIKRAHYKRIDKNGFSENQKYEITPNPDAPEEMVKYSAKHGRWQMGEYTPVSLKGADRYEDPHF